MLSAQNQISDISAEFKFSFMLSSENTRVAETQNSAADDTFFCRFFTLLNFHVGYSIPYDNRVKIRQV